MMKNELSSLYLQRQSFCFTLSFRQFDSASAILIAPVPKDVRTDTELSLFPNIPNLK